ncbi:MAG TPA: class I SAM-dependent methyltransferase [Steroidobacteraceae bacterium]
MFSIHSLSPDIKARIKRSVLPRAPARLAAKFSSLTDERRAVIEDSLRRHYFTRPVWGKASLTPQAYLESPEGREDFADHVWRRLQGFRDTVVPWLDAAHPLEGANILEIGCGTGSSTVALAEQGANVVAIDVDKPSLNVAGDRLRAYGLNAELLHANATEAPRLLRNRRFDFIIFFACLEHMTHCERIPAMRETWEMLPDGGLWCLVETPNRLWFFDFHTAHLPFYSWLPNDLAFEYARLSPRKPFCDSYREPTEEAMLSFLRQGRGVSFHEFDLAIKDATQLNVVSSLPLWLRAASPLHVWELGWRMSLEGRFEACLMKMKPGIHRGFYQPSLDLIIRKD